MKKQKVITLVFVGFLLFGIFYFLHTKNQPPFYMSTPSPSVTALPMLPVLTMDDPYDKPGIIDIGISTILAEHMPGGILVRGVWDKPDQGVFTAIPDAESFTRLKNAEGAPTHYFKAGKNVYMFKTASTTIKTTWGYILPIPTVVQGVDVNTFIPGISTDLGFIAKDTGMVYFDGIPASTIDPKTVAPIIDSKNMFKDKDYVYEATWSLDKPYAITDFDPKTFAILVVGSSELPELYYAKDKNGVYLGKRKIIGVDLNTFSVFISPQFEAGTPPPRFYSYSRDKEAVYYSTKDTTIIVSSADPDTFHSLGGNFYDDYGSDASHVFYLGELIEGANPKTFVSLTWQPKEGCSPAPYSKDDTHVFFGTHIVKGADPKSFEAFQQGRYGKDKDHVYDGDKMRPNLDVKTFQYSCGYG